MKICEVCYYAVGNASNGTLSCVLHTWRPCEVVQQKCNIHKEKMKCLSTQQKSDLSVNTPQD